MKSLLISSAIASMLVASPAMSFEEEQSDPLLQSLSNNREANLAEFFSVTEKAEWVASLPPTQGLVVVKLKNGQYMIIDAGMRFAFEAGAIVDIGNGQVIDTPEKINDAWLVNVDAISSMPLPIFTYGVDKLKADFTVMVAMVDHPSTKAVMDLIRENQNKYRIDVMLMGTTDKTQLLSAGNLYCAEDRKLAKERLLDLKFPLKSDKTTWLDQLPTCKHEDVLSAFNVAKMYSVNKYPFFYNSYGAYMTGVPLQIDKFIEWKPKNMAAVQQFNWDLQGATKDEK